MDVCFCSGFSLTTHVQFCIYIYFNEFQLNVGFVVAVDAEKAVTRLNDRFFAGRRIQAQLYDMTLYKNNDLSS